MDARRSLLLPVTAFFRRNCFELAGYISLVVIYICDVTTPADLSIEVGYEVPIAIVSLAVRRNPIIRMTIVAAIANVLGYTTEIPFLTPAADPVGFQNRVIAFASLILVSALVVILQASAAKLGRLEEQQRAMLVEQELAREIVRRGERLGERQEIIAELVEAIAHDVRTPLEALSLTLNQALRGQYGELPAAYRDVAFESRISIGALTRVAETLLAFARFESGNATPECTAIDAAALAREMVGEFTPLAEAREIALTHDVPDAACVWANSGDLRRAIGNLLANAIRHTSPGGRISLDVRPCSGDAAAAPMLGGESGGLAAPILWKVEVVDDGVGVSAAQAATLFSRYQRGAAGTGIGLHIVKRIVESFGGTASYEPVSPRGSRFSLTLGAPKAAA